MTHHGMTGAVLCGLALLATPALAHPHIFIDASVEVLLDGQNRATGLRIGWRYDDLYSLSVIADRGLDPDWDGALTAAEESALAGFDMAWMEGFQGDTYALLDAADLRLGPPQDWTAGYAGGKITSTHLRMFAAPVAIGEGTLFVQVYDPGFYTSYAIVGDGVLTGGSGACRAEVWGPDVDAADAALLAALAEYSADESVEQDFPAVGRHYAEEVRVTCAAR
ncbi:MAG: DUF1007 family protein [Rhodobacter sp.]|nr:DUF1007 family protein [Rhodobacter sp.]